MPYGFLLAVNYLTNHQSLVWRTSECGCMVLKRTEFKGDVHQGILIRQEQYGYILDLHQHMLFNKTQNKGHVKGRRGKPLTKTSKRRLDPDV
ncbi:hypothetical protein DPEC_G00283200 [Dallia pectoralis]|uniref:Uncharacterized protein n=1 Tax=Dallia pectoralis TaxID=75939 RepID=A0ACC2FJ20_DALPE|nr:hypothetical protein DPEC_G00283200 [Dallia pectoralis]